MQHRLVIAAFGFALACAAAPDTAPERATAWGYVKLVPKTGLPADEGGYTDRRLRGEQRFDYSHPEFAVVFAPAAPPPPAETRELAIEDGPGGPHWSAPISAIGANDPLRIANRTAAAQVISVPELAWLRELAPAEAAELVPARSGELLLHSLGGNAGTALVWISPGAFALASSAGRYELHDLPPGVVELRAWHPRLPPAAGRSVSVTAGSATRVDLEIGVDQAAGARP